MPATLSSIEARAALRAAAATTASRLSPGHGTPSPRHLALLSEAELPPAPTVWTDRTALPLVALFAARARRDALSDGVSAVRRYFDDVRLRRAATLSAEVRSGLYASVGEYCNALGWPQMGARFGREALLFADSGPLRYRALSVVALGFALNGEYTSAQTALDEAEETFIAREWTVGETAYLVLLAHILVAAARLDSERLLTQARRLSTAQPSDPYWGYSARTAEVAAMMFSRDYGAARAAGRQLLTGTHRHTSHRMMRYFLVSMVSDIMVAQGDHRDALALLEPFENPEGHGICFSMQRAAALLRLGRERDLLAETEHCVASEADHCLRTLTPLLVRRALAWNRLGSHRRARDTMEAALMLIAQTGMSATPFLMLPHGETRALIVAAAAEHPELAPQLPHLLEMLSAVAVRDGDVPTGGSAGALTPTERALATLLPTRLSLAEMAVERGVSLNTVKTQVRSIYHKLGVGNRPAAVARLLAEEE